MQRKGGEAPDASKCVRLFVLTDSKGRKRKRSIDYRSYNELSAKVPEDDVIPFDITKFVLYKENVDTQYVLSLLARHLKIKPSRLGYAGTKDKRGITGQWCTAFKVPPKKLWYFNKTVLSRSRICLGNFQGANESLKLGDLRGNLFEVILREANEADRAKMVAAVKLFETRGFLNYYGMQRFGTGGTPTHKIGIPLLKGEWRLACKLILTERGADDDAVKDAKRRLVGMLDTGKQELSAEDKTELRETLKLLPRNAIGERAVVKGMLDYGLAGLAEALRCVPKTLRLMYMHAYQSYLWNNAASTRIESFSSEHAVAGDIVYKKAAAEGAEGGEGGAEGAEGEGGEGALENPHELKPIRFVTEEEEREKSVGIDEVLLPLPGQKVSYPKHGVADVYKTLLAADGISFDDSAHTFRDFSTKSLAGAYRNVLQVPKSLEYSFIKYSDKNEQLVRTDYEEVRSKGGNKNRPSTRIEAGEYLALKLDFELPSSAYATMAVRQLTGGKVLGMVQ